MIQCSFACLVHVGFTFDNYHLDLSLFFAGQSAKGFSTRRTPRHKGSGENGEMWVVEPKIRALVPEWPVRVVGAEIPREAKYFLLGGMYFIIGHGDLNCPRGNGG